MTEGHRIEGIVEDRSGLELEPAVCRVDVET